MKNLTEFRKTVETGIGPCLKSGTVLKARFNNSTFWFNGSHVESSLAEFRHLYRRKCRFRILFIEPLCGCRFPTKSK